MPHPLSISCSPHPLPLMLTIPSNHPTLYHAHHLSCIEHQYSFLSLTSPAHLTTHDFYPHTHVNKVPCTWLHHVSFLSYPFPPILLSHAPIHTPFLLKTTCFHIPHPSRASIKPIIHLSFTCMGALSFAVSAFQIWEVIIVAACSSVSAEIPRIQYMFLLHYNHPSLHCSTEDSYDDSHMALPTLSVIHFLDCRVVCI